MRQRNNISYNLIKETSFLKNNLRYYCEVDFVYNTGTSANNSYNPDCYDPGEAPYIEEIYNIEIIKVIDDDTDEEVLNYPPMGELDYNDYEDIIQTIEDCDLELED
jgi:hypothetical protein